MTNKITFLIIPLIISSIADMPVMDTFASAKAISNPVITFNPIESSIPSMGNDYFNCNLYGPFDLETITNISVTFTYEFHTVASQQIVERVRLLDSNNSVVSSATKAAISYTRGFRNSVTFVLPLTECFTRNGLTLKFEIVSKSSALILKAFSASFYPASKSRISGVTLKRTIYRSKSVGFYGDGEKMNEAVETFDFTHFGDFLDVDYYYRLDINKNTFSYPNPFDFTYDFAYLWFNDDDNLFPYCNHTSNGDIYIPISLVRKEDTVSFKLNKTYYVNRKTLQISDTYRSGFFATNDFYLPVNGRSKFNNKQLWFELNNMGLDGISTSIPVRYDTSKSLVGVCKDGDYCIIGGKR